jgi:hypothetical protein
MIINRKINNKKIGGAKSRSPALVNGQITMCRVGRKKELDNMKWTGKNRKEIRTLEQ